VHALQQGTGLVANFAGEVQRDVVPRRWKLAPTLPVRASITPRRREERLQGAPDSSDEGLC
jgi:hypothetical protein